MTADNVRDLRALLREAAHALSAPLAPYDHSLSARLWAAHDALTVDALNHPAIPDGSDLKKASTAPIPAHPDDEPSADDLFWCDAANILCRVFDDLDVAMEEFRAFYDPTKWLHGYRALGAFIRTRIDRNRSETPKSSGKTEMRDDRRDTLHTGVVTGEVTGVVTGVVARDDRRDHDRHPPRTM